MMTLFDLMNKLQTISSHITYPLLNNGGGRSNPWCISSFSPSIVDSYLFTQIKSHWER